MPTVAELWETTEAPAPAESKTMPSRAKRTGTTVADLWEDEEALAAAAAAEPVKPVREIDKPLEKRSMKDLAINYLQEAAVYPDIIAGAVTAPAAVTGYLTRRAMGETPEEAEATVQSYMKPFMAPVGELTGAAATPGYQQAAPMQIMQKAGEIAEIPVKAAAEYTGIPQQDISNVLGAAGMFAAGARPMMARAQQAGEAMRGMAGTAQEALMRGRPIEAPILTPQQAMEQFRARGGQAPFMGEAQPPVQPAETMRLIGGPEVEAQPPTPAGVQQPLLPGQPGGPSIGAAGVGQRPFTLVGEETARGEFPQVKLHRIGEALPPEQQNLRAAIAQEIMGDRGIRTSAISGDENILRNEIERSKLTDESGNLTPEAELMRSQLAAEQRALTDYAQARVKATGADESLPDDLARGERLNDAFFGEDGLAKQIREQKKGIYDEAAATVGNKPIGTDNLKRMLADDDFQTEMEMAEVQSVAKGLSKFVDKHEAQGLKGNDPGSLASYEEIRKVLNARRNAKNAYFIDRLKSALDEDVAQAGGPELYARARQVHRAEQALFEIPGFKKIFGEVDEMGIKAGAPEEQMVAKLNRLPTREWMAIYDTFDTLGRGEMPGNLRGLTVTPELQAYAQAAAAEMKGGIARDIYKAGATKVGEWNSNAANKLMNQYANKIQHAFDPDERTSFHILNAGGQLMPGSMPYEGAGRQMRRMGAVDKTTELAKRAAAATEAAAAAKGLPTFGLPTRAAEKVGEARSAAARQKAAAQTERELRENVQRGRTALSEMLPGRTPKQ